jgi:general secretion pathway protein I
MTRRRKGPQAGFSLLEAIIAIAILAGALIPIYAAISTSLQGAQRLGDINLGSEIGLNALEALDVVNPMATPEGEIDFGLYRMKWLAKPLAPAIDQAGYPRGIGLYQIGFFEMSVDLIGRDGTIINAFQVRKVGWKLIRQPRLPFSAAP